MIYNDTLTNHAKLCDSYTIYIILFAIFILINVSISSVFIYLHWYFKKDNIRVKFNTNSQTTISLNI